MLRSNFFKKKARSKKGFSLVEAMCSIVILAIVTVGVLNAVAFSREMIYTNNARDKASDKAQLVADEIISAVTGVDPALGSQAFNNIDMTVNAIANDSTGADVQARAIGKVARVGVFETPDDDNDALIQYILTPREVDYDEDVVKTFRSGDTGEDVEITVTESVQSGWQIDIRVYYKQIGGGNAYKMIDLHVFAPVDVANRSDE